MVDRDFGNWLAGFIDGEGCFSIVKIKKRPAGHRPIFSLAVRADDSEIVRVACEQTGLGTVHLYTGQNGNRVIRWMVQSRGDCAGLVSLLTVHPLRAKKRHDFEIWCTAVTEASKVKIGRGQDNTQIEANLLALKAQLSQSRVTSLEKGNQL